MTHKKPILIERYFTRSAWYLLFFLASLYTIAPGCQSVDDPGAGDSGEVIIGLTDAEGDLAAYTVDVLSLTLTRNDGTIVETLPLTTRVDFAQYTELTEILTAATVPAGTYTKAGMVLSYSQASIQAEDPAGAFVPVTDIRDIDGNSIQTLMLSVQLDGRDRIVIAPGIPAHLTLDFDLEASNRMDFTGANPVLTVAPFLAADVLLQEPKLHRLRGPLASVDVDRSRFHLIIRPFRHVLAEDKRRFGNMDVHVTPDTVYEINGMTYGGAAGLVELDAQPQLTAVIATGELVYSNGLRRLVARQVYAGSSVPNGEDDVVHGHVIARTGNTLKMHGATLIRADGSVIFNDTLDVNVDVTTLVTRQLATGSYDIGDISVGQRLTVFGTASGDPINGFTMDATDGRVRMRLTTVAGSAVQHDSPLALELDRIGRYPVGKFDFGGTGVDVSNDADAAFYEISTGSLDLSGIGLNDPLKVRGFVRAFGMAPEDFDAQTLELVTAARARMTVNWNPTSGTAFAEIRPDYILLDLDGTGPFHHVVRSGIRTDLTGLANAPALVPNDTDGGVYTIRLGGSTLLFTNFADFSRTLADYMDTSAGVETIRSEGHFNEADATLATNRASVVLE